MPIDSDTHVSCIREQQFTPPERDAKNRNCGERARRCVLRAPICGGAWRPGWPCRARWPPGAAVGGEAVTSVAAAGHRASRRGGPRATTRVAGGGGIGSGALWSRLGSRLDAGRARLPSCCWSSSLRGSRPRARAGGRRRVGARVAPTHARLRSSAREEGRLCWWLLLLARTQSRVARSRIDFLTHPISRPPMRV